MEKKILAVSGDQEKVRKLNSKFNLKAKEIESKARFFLADRREVLFMVTPENSEEEIAVWLNTPFFTPALSFMFEQAVKDLKKI